MEIQGKESGLSTSTRNVLFEKTYGDVSGRIEIRFDRDSSELTQILELRHRDGTVVRDELGFNGKSYMILSSIEGVFDAPAVFGGSADAVSEDALIFRDIEWMDTPVPDFKGQPGGCAISVPEEVPVHEAFADWKPIKKTRVKSIKSLVVLAEFMKAWQDDLQQEMVGSNPPDDGTPGDGKPLVPKLIAYLMCLSSCYGMYLSMLAIVGVGLAASTANPGAAVAAMAAAMATLLVALLQCEMACAGLYWNSQGRPGL